MIQSLFKTSSIRKSSYLLGLTLLVLLVISISMIRQISHQQTIINHELNEKLVKDTIASQITYFEDKLSRNTDRTVEETLEDLQGEFDWLLSLNSYNASQFSPETAPNLFLKSTNTEKPNISENLVYLSLFPLVSASQNLPNRFFYGVALEFNKKDLFLPFAHSKKDNLGNILQIYGWIDVNKFVKKTGAISKLDNQYFFLTRKFELSSFQNRIINNNIPKLQIGLKPKNFSENAFDLLMFDFSTNPLALLMIGINLLLWFSVSLSFLEHFKRIKSENKLKNAISRGLQQARLASIGEMASGLAHEINQPLATIETYAGLAENSISTKQTKQNFCKEVNFLQEIRKQTERCSSIIKSVLSLKASNTVDLEWLALSELKEDLEPLLDLNAERNKTKLIWDFDNELKVFSNKIALQQIIFNICINGIEAMQSVEQSKRVLMVSSKFFKNHKQKFIKIKISDRGCGIKPGEAKDLFTPFVTHKKNGTGLGLSLCKSLSEKCFIEIVFSPNEFQGTDFELVIPSYENKISSDFSKIETSHTEEETSLGAWAK